MRSRWHAVADLVPQAVSKTLVGGLYIHAPNWLGYELVLVLPVLGALGLAAWPRASRAARRAAVGAAVTVAVVLPVLLGVDWQSSLIAGLGIVAAVAVLKMGERDQRLLWLLPLLLVGELGVAQVHPAGIWATRPLGTEPTDLAAYAQSPLVPPAILDRSAFTHRLTSPGAGRFIVADTSRARAHALAGRLTAHTQPAWFVNWPMVSGAHGVAGTAPSSCCGTGGSCAKWAATPPTTST